MKYKCDKCGRDDFTSADACASHENLCGIPEDQLVVLVSMQVDEERLLTNRTLVLRKRRGKNFFGNCDCYPRLNDDKIELRFWEDEHTVSEALEKLAAKVDEIVECKRDERKNLLYMVNRWNRCALELRKKAEEARKGEKQANGGEQ